MEEGASPAVKAAAEAKAEEDKAEQKAKAIRYLASRGCGKCYPDTEAALLAALDDCTEVVRYETVKGLRKAAGRPCQSCQVNSCCTPKLIEKLTKLGYEQDAQGCYFEPSDRVRRYARLVVETCMTAIAVSEQEPTPAEGPTANQSLEPPAEGPQPPATEGNIGPPSREELPAPAATGEANTAAESTNGPTEQ